ncbi:MULTISPECIES: exodeoxyribonuclease VII small subunit [Pusillimonas]|uniref:Exodeoxyribonuclease 7 small subunit n=1 Tax=Pusillimonas minor TaxID=2697024 RepID=A0A842HRJ7_9BURK|nr:MULTISPECIES: exodeoxyribonuclease VII small subunit [Pusillimonas]MBC2770816.1 exodeoxyribonuclease VII small subunit [Pusillimonas minor]OXR49233.1 exodeoxyribonuclease VII small subunit [Pusillimonas sp. T2]ROT46151.1 exodeoxyribonuclease VII small subunit [Pusillimonas sp. NJUB218]
MADQSADSAPGVRKPKSEPLPKDFETALAQLEALVAQMENGELPLEASLAAYERGVELSKICQKLLDKADEQVKVLQGNLLKPLDDRGPDEE